MPFLQQQVGPQTATDAAPVNLRGGRLGDLIVSELQGRFYESAYRGQLFRTGTTGIVAMTANHNTTNGLSATLGTAAVATPMLGLWNPVNSGKNLVLAQAMLQMQYNTVTTPVPPGALVWAVSQANGAISTGLIPWNSGTLTQAGSQAKGFAGATALTGLSNVLTAMENADFYHAGNVTYGTIGNTVVTPSVGGVQNFDGQLSVPPGAVLALYNTTSTTTFSYTGRLLWTENPV